MLEKNNKAAVQGKDKPKHIHFFHPAVNSIVSPNFIKLKESDETGSTDFRAETQLDMSSHCSGKKDMTVSSLCKISDNFMAPYAFVFFKSFNPKNPEGMIHEFCSMMKTYFGSSCDVHYIMRVISGSASVLKAIFLTGNVVFIDA